MSLINQVLKDIDSREQKERAEERAIPGVTQVQKAKPAWVFVLLGTLGSVLILLALLVALRMFTTKGSVATDESPEAQTQTEMNEEIAVAEVAEPPAVEKAVTERAEPIHASETYPVAQVVDEPATPVEQERAEATEASSTEPPEPVETAVPEQPVGQMQIQRTQVSAQQLAEQRFQQAMQALQQGDRQTGAKSLQEALVLMPNYHEAREQLAVYYFSQGFMSDALNLLEQGLEAYPQTPRLMLLQARMLERAEQKEMALTLLERVQDRLPEHLDLLILRGALAHELGRFELAHSTYQTLTAWHASEGRWWLGLAMAEAALNKPAAALTAYRNAAMDPSLATATRTFIHEQIEELQQ